ncbi:ash family protein, partial [Escherichia coli]|nr:ash family protein [Escherichia coli]MCK3395175.1 ash family protein [Escherichia coli]
MIPVQKKTFSLAGMSPKSSNMTAKSGINTADASKVYHLLVVGTDALTIPEISGDDISIEKVSGCARKFLVVDDVFRSCSDSTKTFVHVRDVNEMSAMYCASGASNTEFSESIKKSLPLCGNTVYGYSAPAKSGAGRGNPNTLRATQTPKASFFVSDHYAHQISGLVRTVSMVALVGLRSRRPVSFVSGISTPANVTAISERGNSGGDSLNTKEAAIMATTPTQKPSFIWLIAAVRRDMPTITAKI